MGEEGDYIPNCIRFYMPGWYRKSSDVSGFDTFSRDNYKQCVLCELHHRFNNDILYTLIRQAISNKSAECNITDIVRLLPNTEITDIVR